MLSHPPHAYTGENMSQSEVWGAVEARKAANGEFPAPSNPDQELYIEWIRNCDARKCHSMLLQKRPVNPLLTVRALMFRGRLAEAQKAILAIDETSGPPELRSDATLEKARLAVFEGGWVLSRAFATQALESQSIESISYLSCLQVRALASFELGNLMEALKDLTAAESMGTVYPCSVARHYARILQARITARNESPGSGIASLSRIWSELPGLAGPTADQVHALIFGEVDIRKYDALHCGGSLQLEKMALASYLLTEAMGERLYAAIAALDLSVCGPAGFRSHFRKQAESFRSEFTRIDRVLTEIDGIRECSSASAFLLAELQLRQDRNVADVKFDFNQKYLVETERGWVFHLQPWKAFNLARHPQILKAFRALNSGPRSKQDFFSTVWGIKKYVPRLHDQSIWYLLNRIRKLTGVSFVIRSRMIENDGGVLIL